ncbi:MAG: PAS domain-containing protein [Flavobacteriales bacterium]|nr:PAS domain-containing protein [Flavobacteriales bacterium]
MENTDTAAQKEVNTIEDLLFDLTTKVKLDPDLSYVNDRQYDQLVNGINQLSVNIYNHKEVSVTSRDRLEHLTDVITSMGRLDFSHKAMDSGNHNHLDYFSISLNLLRKTLDKKIKEIQFYHDITHSSTDLVIVTDTKGKIVHINNQLKEFLGYDHIDLIKKDLHTIITSTDGRLLLDTLLDNDRKEVQHNHKIPIQNIVFRLKHKVKPTILVNTSVSALKNKENRSVGFIFTMPRSSFTRNYGYNKIEDMCHIFRKALNGNDQLSGQQWKELLKMIVEELEVMIPNSPSRI